MARERPLRAFTLEVRVSDYVDSLRPVFYGNASRVVNALVREAALARGDYSFFGLAEPEPSSTPTSTQGSTMRIEIIPAGKTAAPLHYHQGEVFAETPAAGNYIVRLYNNSVDTIEAVLAVDGIDACDGKNASHQSRGYVLNPNQTLDVKGWFRTNQEAAAFVFEPTGSGNSYAEKTGRGVEYVGTVDVAVFKEVPKPSWSVNEFWKIQQQQQQKPHWPTIPDVFYGQPDHNIILRGSSGNVQHTYTSTVSAQGVSTQEVPTKSIRSSVTRGTGKGRHVAVSASISAPSNVSTGYGSKVETNFQSVTFTRASQTPAEVVSLRYATREQLIAWGVPLDKAIPPRPAPFGQGPGVPAPAGWTG